MANVAGKDRHTALVRACAAGIIIAAAAVALGFGVGSHKVTVFVEGKVENAAPSAPPPGAPPLFGAPSGIMLQAPEKPRPTVLTLPEATAVEDITVGRLTRVADGKIMRGEAAAACPT
jgi:hypothetical protein